MQKFEHGPSPIKSRLRPVLRHSWSCIQLARSIFSFESAFLNDFNMKKVVLLAFVTIFLVDILEINAQTTPTTSTTTIAVTTTDVLDAGVGGKFGNPGGQIRFSTKALDAIYSHAIAMIARAIRSMVIPDIIVPIGGGMLTIKSARVTEAKLGNYSRQLIPPNRIRSRFTDGRLVSIGQWQYRPMNGARQLMTGIFRTVVVGAELNVTNQMARTWDAKPMVQTAECKAYLGQFRVEIEGFGDNTTIIDQCNNLLCLRIRSYFEDSVCNTARNYIKEQINQKLSTFPTRINLGPTGNRFVLDYNLLMGEPKVTSQYIQAYLEGEVLSRGSVAAPFYANDLAPYEDGKRRMISFPLSDYAFNTLLHHAHIQQYPFSAIDLLPSNSSTQDLLKMECPVTRAKVVRISPLGRQAPITPLPSALCLGSVFDNVTVGQFPTDAKGDLVFKSQRPLQVVVHSLPDKSYFGVNSGMIEAYGPVGTDGKRELLGRTNIQSLRGEFMPKLSECNISGSVKITDLQLMQPTPAPIRARVRVLADPTLTKLSQLAVPVLTEVFNVFLDQFAQFPLPLVDGYACDAPELCLTPRTLQIHSDIRVLPDATRDKTK